MDFIVTDSDCPAALCQAQLAANVAALVMFAGFAAVCCYEAARHCVRACRERRRCKLD